MPRRSSLRGIDSSTSTHRRDIDGWRGLAVALVLLFHAWPRLLPGGFVGVDVFFVISGFVVSRMVQRQLAAGSFRVIPFFIRRVNRLAPALLLMLVATLAFAAAFLSPRLLAQVVAHAAAGLALVANLLSALQAGYFDQLAEVKPLLHLWSLAVEEQFYLVVPFAVLATRRLGRATHALTLAFALASLVASIWLTRTSPPWAYALPVTRAWELLAGVLVAQRAPATATASRRLREVVSVLGLCGVLASALLFDRTTPFPGAWALLPVGGAAALLWAGPDTLVGVAASSRLPVSLGLISYPLYLWHWPALVLGRLTLPAHQHAVATPLLLAGAGIAAFLTWRFVERPVRARQSRVVALVLSSTAAALAVGLTALQLALSPEDWAFGDASAARVAHFERSYDYRTDARLGTCWLLDEVGRDDAECMEREPAAQPLVVVWGDSHAARFTAGLRALQHERSVFRVGQRTRSSCPPLLEVSSLVCREANEQVLDELSQVRPSVVVLNARWSDSGDALPAQLPLQRLREVLPDTTVVVVGAAPEWRFSLPWVLSMQAARGAVPERLRLPDLARQRALDKRLAEATTRAGARYVSALDGLCTPDGDCLVRLAEEPLMLTTWDYGHLTTPAAKALARRVALAWEGIALPHAPTE
ncbi:MAG: acyltransferase [Myxococcaceae bacterium]|nr:acyltransferase [Myxococcaceae bacterium]